MQLPGESAAVRFSRALYAQAAFSEVIGLLARFHETGAIRVFELHPVLDHDEKLRVRSCEPSNCVFQPDHLIPRAALSSRHQQTLVTLLAQQAQRFLERELCAERQFKS